MNWEEEDEEDDEEEGDDYDDDDDEDDDEKEEEDNEDDEDDDEDEDEDDNEEDEEDDDYDDDNDDYDDDDEELKMDGSGVAAGDHSGNVLWETLSITFTEPRMADLSTLGTICGTSPWSEGTRSLSNRPLPLVDTVSYCARVSAHANSCDCESSRRRN
ncbi:hypothetical protein Fmac_018035 [Flemingia macrophylla]|uniref:Uncharacterized protein n=1 Tax=Flemingia macrophylla TaxID=520843 RepID=A0ABD1M3T7_9FABA